MNYERMTLATCQTIERFQDEALARPGKSWPAVEKFPLRVMVVDDEPLIRWSVAASLGDLGFAVEEAGDAASALRIVTTSARPFHVVVLDLRLPDMHDLSLAGTLRQLLPHARLILMTAFGTPELLAQARAIGVDVLLKPFELDELNCLVSHDRRNPN
jgi:CheY-like chemotaxis protein